LWYTAVVLATLLVFRLVSVQVIRSSLYQDLDASLRAEAEWVAGVLATYKEQDIPDQVVQQDIERRSRLSPRKEFIEIFDKSGVDYFRSPNLAGDELRPLAPNDLSEPVTLANFRNQSLRLFGLKNKTYEIYIGYPLTDVEAAVEEIFSSFFTLVPVTLALLVGGGLFLVSRFLRPLRELNRYAAGLIRQPLDQELPQVAVTAKDEIGILAEQINEAVSKMRRSMWQVLRFASLASHELRAPLAVMRNHLEETLQPHVPAPVLSKALIATYDEILRLSRIVDDLLSLATLQAGTFKLESTRTGFYGVLEEFCDEALFLAREKNISILLAPGPEVFVELDVMRFRQVLFNLFDNALKHTPENGRIHLSYETQNREVVFQFRDSGGGIPPDELSKIFDFFYKGDTPGGVSPGAGLGLALVKWIVEAHHGKITVQSELGKGTAFIMRLPIY
jgi:signal transduction histidine kinase